MDTLSHRRESLAAGRVTRYALSRDTQPLSYRQALDLLAGDVSFRQYLSNLLAQADFESFRWETPPITRATVDRVFEFVLVHDPYLQAPPEPQVFAEHFVNAGPAPLVLPLPNLGRTATLVVPRQLDAACAYPHLAAFVRTAPEQQLHALWQCVAVTAQQQLSDSPMWISTAGGGVAWLHVRLEGTPKYYAHRPYATEA
jgi:hypothetical protein